MVVLVYGIGLIIPLHKCWRNKTAINFYVICKLFVLFELRHLTCTLQNEMKIRSNVTMLLDPILLCDISNYNLSSSKVLIQIAEMPTFIK